MTKAKDRYKGFSEALRAHFLEGYGSVLDLSGKRRIYIVPDGYKADMEAIRKDWEQIEKDFTQAFKQYTRPVAQIAR